MKKDTLYIIDLDRTLIDIAKVMEAVKEACKSINIDPDKILEEQARLAEKDISYSPLDYISERAVGNLEEFKKAFIESSAGGELFFEDTLLFLEQLKLNSVDHIIVTYGLDEEWQSLKIKASGLSEIPLIIIKDRYKGRLIKSWYSKGKISPGMAGLGNYEKCVLVDDRAVAFTDLPSSCTGYLLDRVNGSFLESKLPDSVKIVQSLSEIQL